MFESIEKVQQQYKIGIQAASFLYTLGYVPPIGTFPKSIPIEDLVSIVQRQENSSADEAQLSVRWERNDIHRSRAVEVMVEV